MTTPSSANSRPGMKLSTMTPVRLRNFPDPRESFVKFLWVVGADDAAAGGKGGRLENAGVRRVRCGSIKLEAWDQQPGIAEFFAREEFVFRGGDGGGWAEAQTEALGCLGGDESRLIAHRDDAIERSARGEGIDTVGDGNGVVAPGIFENVTSVGGEDQIESQTRGSAKEWTW